jgi:hypothetical protein
MLTLLALLAACDLGKDDAGDADGDGFGASVDCDDASSAIHPGADELCDGLDDDCDGEVDEDPVDGVTTYTDADGDGFGDDRFAGTACDAAGPPAGGDCDDPRDDAHPGAPELCNGVDDDCDGAADEDTTEVLTWYRDGDGDGYGEAGQTVESCEAPDGYSLVDGDCDDGDDDVSPGADEHCDGEDEDCDGETDEDAVDGDPWYPDDDGDGYGDTDAVVTACAQPPGAVPRGGDCDDGDDDVGPGGVEVCDDADADEDCDGFADDDDSSVGGTSTWYRDADGDGYGDAAASFGACAAPPGYVASAEDCADDDASASPDGVEVCGDGVDNDCDGTLNGCGLSGTDDLTAADASWEGEAFSDWLGSVAFPGDVDDDGTPDVAMGAYGYDVSGTTILAGRTWIAPGDLLDLPLGDLPTTITGVNRSEESGMSISAAGDVDGDGIADLALSSPYYGGGGRGFVFTGPVTGALDTSDADVTFTATGGGDYLGFPIRGVGDLDGDGNDDMALGAYGYDGGATTEAGGVGLFLGPLSGSVSFYSADTRITASTTYDRFGAYVAGPGDYDGDGFGDVAAAAVGYDNGGESGAGAVYVFAGPPGSGIVATSLYTSRLVGSTEDAAFGHSVASAGDVDGDGYDDLLVGAWNDDGTASTAGAAYLFLGSSAGVTTGSDGDADATIPGETTYDETGEAVAGGDVDADGLSDLVIGQPARDADDLDAGRVLLIYGPVTGTRLPSDADWLVEGSGWGANFGSELDVSDVDLDGAADILVGGPGWAPTDATSDAGGVWLFLGGGG